VGADCPDAVGLGPAVGADVEHAGDAAEPFEEELGCASRDAGYSG